MLHSCRTYFVEGEKVTRHSSLFIFWDIVLLLKRRYHINIYILYFLYNNVRANINIKNNYYNLLFLRLINLLLEKEKKTKSDEWRMTLSLFVEEGYCSSASCWWSWKYVATQPELRRHVEVATSGRSWDYVGTYFCLSLHAVGQGMKHPLLYDR